MSDLSEDKRITVPTGLIQVGWPGGTLTLRYTGIPKDSEEARAEIQHIMQEFSADCQMMLIWFAGILGSQDAMRRHLDSIAERAEPFTINTYRPDGRVQSVLARVPLEKVIDAFSTAGEFERLYAKAFVVFIYQVWEEVARPRIATALGLETPNHIISDLMGDWRRLRNWLIHQTKTTEEDFFKKSKTLPGLLGMQRNEPFLTANMVSSLMKYLNQMQIDVNPRSLDFGLELTTLDPGMIAEVAKTLESGGGMVIPATASMYPSAVIVVFNDGPTATIHETDCTHKNVQFQSVDGGRWIRVTSLEVARGVVEKLGKSACLCDHCLG